MICAIATQLHWVWGQLQCAAPTRRARYSFVTRFRLTSERRLPRLVRKSDSPTGRATTMSASTETKVQLLPRAESRLISAFRTKLGELRRVFAQELGCEHDELVFDDINDVSCKHCGKDFTG